MKTEERVPTTKLIRDALLIIILTAMVFLPSLKNGFVDFDDPSYILNNQAIQTLSFESLSKIWFDVSAKPYYPTVFMAYTITHAVFDTDPFGYHLVSLLFHVLNAVLAYLLVARLFNSRTVALITGLLVGLHPIHTDSVAWASDLKNILGATLVFTSLLFYLHYSRHKGKLQYLLALAFYVLALMSRPLAALLPFMLFIIDYQQRRNDVNKRTLVFEKIPFFAVALILGYITFRAQAGVASTPDIELLNFYDRTNAWAAIGFYLLKLTAPLKLSVLYGNTHSDWWNAAAIAISVAFVVLTLWMPMLSRNYGFGLAWFVLLAFPILGFVPFGYVVRVAPYANHFMYLADVGLFIVAGLVIRDSLKRIEDMEGKALLLATVVAALTLFSYKSYLRCGTWENSETLWRDAIRYNRSPNATIGYYRLAIAQQANNNIEDAIDNATKAVEKYPEHQAAKELLRDLQALRK